MFAVLSILVVVGFSMRDILQKHTAPHYQHHYEAGAIPAIFTFAGVLVMAYPLQNYWFPAQNQYIFWLSFYDTIIENHPSTIIVFWSLCVGLIKGFIVFLFNSGARNLDISSVSGGAYLAFISVGAGSLMNQFFFNENTRLVPILIIFASAFIFYLSGPGRKVLHDGKLKTLIFCTSGLATLICLDYIGIRASNWFFHLSLSNTAALIFFVILVKKGIIGSFQFLTHPLILLSGLIYVLMEFIFVFSFSILGVSYAFVLGMLSYLPTMVIGSLKYQEGKWYTQAAFAIIAVSCVYALAT